MEGAKDPSPMDACVEGAEEKTAAEDETGVEDDEAVDAEGADELTGTGAGEEDALMEGGMKPWNPARTAAGEGTPRPDPEEAWVDKPKRLAAPPPRERDLCLTLEEQLENREKEEQQLMEKWKTRFRGAIHGDLNPYACLGAPAPPLEGAVLSRTSDLLICVINT